jgi:hypothetical protein
MQKKKEYIRQQRIFCLFAIFALDTISCNKNEIGNALTEQPDAITKRNYQ